MPCIYEPTQEEIEASRKAADDKRKAERERARIRKAELDKATRLLCSVCSSLERASGHIKLASDILRGEPELLEWWEAHKAADEKRRAREEAKRKKREAKERKKARIRRLREAAISKLTDEEKAALGL